MREGYAPPRVEEGAVPGPASRELAERLAAVESRNVTFRSEEFPVFWEEARGANVWDADGNRYVDLTAAFAVAGPGHRHPRVVEAVRRQSERLAHGMGDVHPPAVKVELLERLAELLPMEDPRIVLGTSGSEAVEVALKTARLHTGRPGVIAFTGAYHGLTYGALSVTDRAHFREPFEDQLNPHVRRAPYPHPFRPPPELAEARGYGAVFPEAAPRDTALRDAVLARVEELLATDPAGAVIVEPLQGRGGEVVPPAGFLSGLRALCDDHGALLVVDEIYTGLGRTGRLFACGEEGVVPDLLCVGKALSGCLPISACAGRREVMEAWPPSKGEAKHTSTFLGNPLACAAATASLEVLEEEGLAERAAETGRRWRRGLADALSGIDAVGQVRGRGLMVGVDLVDLRDGRTPDGELAARVTAEMLRRGWIVLPGGPDGNVLSLTPPIPIPMALLEAATDELAEVLQETG
jgi:4-aminobutyrate aminotransferase